MILSGKIIIWSGMLTIFCGKLIICRGKITKIVLVFNIDFPLTCSFDLVTFFHDVVWFCRKRSETFYFERQDNSQWECSSGSSHSPTHIYNNQRSLLCWYVFLVQWYRVVMKFDLSLWYYKSCKFMKHFKNKENDTDFAWSMNLLGCLV